MHSILPIEHEHRPQIVVVTSTLYEGRKCRVVAEYRCADCRKRLPATTPLEMLTLQLLIVNVSLRLQLARVFYPRT